MNKKYKILTITLSSTSAIVVPTITTSTILIENNQKSITQNNSVKKYSILDQEFSSREEAISYANSVTEYYEKRTNSPKKWSLNVNGKLLTFDNLEKLYDYLNQFIISKPFTSYTKDFKVDPIGALYPDELSKMNFDENAKTQTVYRGKNNSIHLTQEEAKLSYFEMHSVYYFNGIFFRTKEELSQWLEKNIVNCNGQVYEISLQNIDGRNSIPISVDLLNEQFNEDKTPYLIDNFVKTNSKPYFEYQDKSSGKTLYISESSINNIINDYDANYVHMKSNQGLGNYIVDTSIDDEADLIGPYYVRSGTELLQIKDNNKWSEISGTNHQIVDEMSEIEFISKFMNLITAAPKQLNKVNSFDEIYSFNDELLQNKVNEYFKELETNLNKVYQSVKNLYDTMKQGKRYGEFLKTPILFIHTIDQLIYYNAEQKYIDKTREIYSLICDYLDEQIYYTVPEKFLIPKKYLDENNNVISSEYKIFSLKEFFKINDKGLDLNYDIQTLIGEIIYEYPNLYEFSKFINYTEIFLSKFNTLEGFEYSSDFYLKPFNFKMNPYFYDEYKLVWDVLNSPDFKTFYNNLSNINHNIEDNKSNYYIYNFISQQITSAINKISIGFWLDREETINYFKLNEHQKTILLKSSLPSTKNELFNMYSDYKYNPPHQVPGHPNKPNSNIINNINYKRYKSNLAFLRNQYDISNRNPILLSRLIMYLKSYPQYYLSDRLPSGDLWNQVNNFMLNSVFNKYENLDKYSIKLYSRFAATNLFSVIDNEDTKNVLRNEILTYKDNKLSDEFISNFEDIYSSSISIFTSISDLIKDKVSGEKIEAWQVVNKYFSIMRERYKIASVFCPWLAIGAAICDFAANFYNKETFSYKFETKNNKFIWNGGMRVSWLYGMIPGNSTTIEDMKLLEPMQVVKGNTSEYYYYNGEKFNDIQTLAKKQLNDILMGRYKSNKLKKVYSLIDLEKNKSPDTNLFNETISGLISSFSNHAKIVLDKIKNNDWNDNDLVIKKSSLKFDSFIYKGTNPQESIEKVISDIKKTFVAQTPILNFDNHRYSGMPLYLETNKDDKSIKPYKLPGKSWTANGGFYQNNDYNFVIVDQNKVDKETNNSNDLNSEEEIIDYKLMLQNIFCNTFNVDSKEVDIKLINGENLFSNLSSKIESQFCYFATGKDKEMNMFLSKNDAINWLLSEFDFKTYYSQREFKTYFINNTLLKSEQEYINWINDNLKEIE